MSHEIERNEDAMFVGAPAWHGIGTVLKNPPTIKEALELSGSNWEPVKIPVFADLNQEGPEIQTAPDGEKWVRDETGALVPMPSHTPDYDALKKVTGKGQIETGHFSIVRNDTGKSLGIVGAGYTPLSNQSAFDFFDPFIKDGSASIEAAGQLSGGKRMWILAKGTESGEVIQDDRVDQYMLLSTSHDGTASVRLLPTAIRVVCANTEHLALDQGRDRGLAMKHTSGINDRIKMAQGLFEVSKGKFKENLGAWQAMAETKMSKDGLIKLCFNAFDLTETTDKDGKVKIPQIVESCIQAWENGRGVNLHGNDETVWRAYNAITEVIDHHHGTANTTDESRFQSAQFGVKFQQRVAMDKACREIISDVAKHKQTV